MKSKSLHISYSFIKIGSVAGTEIYPVLPNRLYLDVGNRLEKGVIDHHQDCNYRSAAEIVCKRPELIKESIPDLSKPVEIILHTNPDLDAISSAYLVTYFLREGKFPRGSRKLIEYISAIDQGEKTIDNMENLKNPFTAAVFLHEKCQKINNENDRNQRILKLIFPIVEQLLYSINLGVEPYEKDSLDWSSEPLFSLISDIEKDKDLYLRDIEDAEKRKNTEILSLFLPSRNMTEWEKVDGLFIDDPSSTLFRYFTKNDTLNSPGKRGFGLTLVHFRKRNQILIATDAIKKYSLLYLGTILEFMEILYRRELRGFDERLTDSKGNLKENRPGFNNPDPWYDGRGHNYTIVASPREGSLIPPERLRKIVATYTKICK